MIRLLAVTLVLLASPAMAAIPCKEHGYQWRLINGKKCWYDAKRQLPKSALYWPPKRETFERKFERQQQRGIEFRLKNCCYPLPGEL